MSNNVDLATLQVDNRQANRSLDETTAKFDQNSAAVEKNTARISTVNRAFDALASKVDGTTQALKRQEDANRRVAAMEAAAERQISAGKVTREQANAVLEEYRRKTLAAASANQTLRQSSASAASEMRARSMAIESSMTAAAGGVGRFRNAVGQMSMQVQDIAVQLAGGQNPFLVIAQQGSQMAGAFGPAGAAIGAVIAIAGGAAMALGGLGGETRELEKAAKAADATAQALDNTLGNSAHNVVDLAAKYKALGSEMRAVEGIAILAAQRKIADESDQLRKSVDAQVAGLEKNRATFELTMRQIAAGATPDPKNVDKFAIMADTFKAIDAYRKGGSIEALTVQIGKLGSFAAETADPLNKVAGNLSESAKRSNELTEKQRLLDAEMRLLNGTATEADKKIINLGTSSGGTAAKAMTLKDVLADVNEEAARLETKRLGDAWSTIGTALENAKTPAEKYLDLLNQTNDAMALVQKRAAEMGDGLSALNPEQIARINEYLNEQDPAWQAAKKSAEDYQRDVSRIANDIGKDISSNLWDQITGEAKANDALNFFKNWAKRIAVEILNQRIVLPITMQVVGGAPSLFGLQAPANQNAPGMSGLPTLPGGGTGLSSLSGTWLDRQLGGGISGVSNWLSSPAYTLGGTSVSPSLMAGIDDVSQLGGVPGTAVSWGQAAGSAFGIASGLYTMTRGGTGNVVSGGGQVIGSALTLAGMPEIGIPVQILSTIAGGVVGGRKASVGPLPDNESNPEAMECAA